VLHGALGGDRGRHQLGLALTGALADAIGVTLVSAGPETFPIGDTHCIFFTRPIVAELFRTDAHGNARTSLTFPDRRGARFYVQQGTIKISPHGVEVGTSNTLEVSCR
jgi:hypothetical protein